MPPSLRKLMLTTHVTASVGWVGALGVFLAHAVVSVASADAQRVRAACIAMGLSAWLVIFPLSLVSLVTGIVQALCTAFGLIRHYLGCVQTRPHHCRHSRTAAKAGANFVPRRRRVAGGILGPEFNGRQDVPLGPCSWWIGVSAGGHNAGNLQAGRRNQVRPTCTAARRRHPQRYRGLSGSASLGQVLSGGRRGDPSASAFHGAVRNTRPQRSRPRVTANPSVNRTRRHMF